MVGIVSGNGLGLFNTSQDILGLAIGQTGLGQANGKAYVNAATGNLSVQFLDESLSGTGSDLSALRTYNSLGGFVDGDADGWRWSGEKRITLQSGTINGAGSVILRTSGDGSYVTFNKVGSFYTSTAGSGSHDTISWDSVTSEWVFNEDTSNDAYERYNGSTGWIKSRRDSSGNGFDYTFAGDKLSTIKDTQSGQTLEFIYGGNTFNQLAQINTRITATGVATKQVSYSYNASGRLSSVITDLTPTNTTDNNVYTTSYTYESVGGRLASVTQSDGTSASFTYNAGGRVISVTDQTGTTTFAYNSLSTTVTNGAGNSSTYTYDALGQLLKVESAPVSGTTQSSTYTYDTAGNVASVKDGRGNTITYTYDVDGSRTKEVDSLGNTITRTFSTTHHVLTETRYTIASLTSPSGAETIRYAYDSTGRLRFTVSPEGRVNEVRYNGLGQATQNIQYAGGTYAVSALAITDSLSETQLTTWVASQDKTKTQLTAFVYDYRGNLTKKTSYANVDATGAGILDNAADVTEYVYSEYGQLLQTIADIGAGHATKVTQSSFAYDGMGRQISAINSGVTTTTTYSGVNITVANSATGLTVVSTTDSAGRLTSITSSGDSTNRITKYYYDASGRLRMSEDPTGARSYLFYDAAGRVNATVNAAGAATVYSYDGDGRVLTETQYASLATTTNWFNGSAVTKTSISVGTSATDILLDAANDRTTTYTYDAAGRLATTTVDGAATITNTYDGESRLVQTTQGSRITKYYYDKDGLKVGMLDAERYLTQYVYDGAGRLTTAVRYGSWQISVAQQATFSFDSLRLLADNAAWLSTHYFYDAEGRQVGVVNEQGFLTETVYDAVANHRQTIQYFTPVTVSESGTFVILETLSAVKARAGTSETTTTNFDNFGRVDTVVTHDSTVSRNVYDTAGRLVRQIQAEGTTDQRATRTQYNAFSEVSGRVSGVGEATLASSPAVAAITTAINSYGTRYDIDGAGRKIAEYGPNGQKTLMYYDNNGQILYTIKVVSNNDSQGNVVYMGTALGEVARFSYNAFGQVAEMQVLNSRIDTTGLTGGLDTSVVAQRVSYNQVTAQDGWTSYKYNKLGLVTSQLDGERYVTINTYNGYGQLNDSVSTLSSGVTTKTSFGYDLLGRAVSTTRDFGGLGSLSKVTYDGFGRIVNTTDANGCITANGYLDNGRTILITDPLGRSNRTEVDAFGRTVKSYDALGSLTSYAYDDVNRKTTVTHPDGTSITSKKTRTGETLQVQDENGGITQYAYTKDGKLDTVTDAMDVVTTDNNYDASGRLYETLDGNKTVTRYSYDAANRVTTKAVDPTGLNIRTTYEFDGQGRQIFVTEGSGTPEASVTKYVYDRKGQITQMIVDPNGLQLSTRFTYDGVGHTTLVEKGTVASPSQQVTKFTFDKLGRKTQEQVDPNGSLNITTQYKYDNNGNLTQKIDANGNVNRFVYDSANQLQFAIDATGAVTENQYDAAGHVISTRQYAQSVPTGNAMRLWHREGTNRSADQDLGIFKAGDVVTATVRFKSAGNSMAFMFLGDSGGPDPYDNSVQSGGYGNDGWQTITLTRTMSHDDYMRVYLYGDVGSTDNSHSVLYDNVRVSSVQRGDVLVENFDNGIGAWNISGFAEVNQVSLAEAGTDAQLKVFIPTLVDPVKDRITRYTYDAVGRQIFAIDATGAVTENQYDAAGHVISTRQYAQSVPTGNAMRLWHSEGTNRSADQDLGIFKAGDVVTATVRFKSAGSSMAFMFLGDSGGPDPYDNSVQSGGYGNDGWQTITLTRTMSHDDYMRVYLYGDVGSTDNSHSVLYDNVRVSSVQRGDVLVENFDNGIAAWNISGFAEVGQVSLAEAGTDAQLKAFIPTLVDPVKDRITRYTYDAVGRQIFAIDATGAVTENQYDAAGHVISTRQYAQSVPTGNAMRLWHREGTNRSADQDLGIFKAGDVVTATVRFKSAGSSMAFMFLGDSGGPDPYDNSVQSGGYGNDGWQTITLTRTMSHDDYMRVYLYGDVGSTDNSHSVLYDNVRVSSVQRGDVLVENFDNGIAAWNISGFAEVGQVSLAEAGTDAQLKAFIPTLADPARDRTTTFIYDKANRLHYVADATGAVSENIYDAAGNLVRKVEYAKRINVPTINSTDNKTLSLNGDSGWLVGTDHVSINTAKSYTVRAKIRQISGQGSVYVGIQTYDSADVAIVNQYQGNFSYAAAAGVLLTPEMGWQTFTGTISGVDPIVAGASYNKFLAGSASAAPLLLYNYGGNSNGDFSRFVELDSLELIDNATGAVLNTNASISNGASNWSLRAGGIEGTNNPTSYLSEAQFQKLLRPDAANDRTTTFIYDKANRLHYVADATGAVSENIYDAAGNLVRKVEYAKRINVPTINSTDNKTLSLNGDSGWLVGTDHVSINTAKSYTVRAKIRQISGQGSVYVGIQTYDSADVAIVNQYQGNFSYAAAAGVLLTPEMGWQTFTGTISGVDPIVAGASYNKFLAGSASAAPLLLYNYGGNSSGDFSRFVELDSLELIDNATGAVLNTNASISNGASNWSLRAGGIEGANNPTSYLSETQFQKLLRPDSVNDRAPTFAYDAAGHLIYSVDAQGAVTENVYNSLGQVTSQIQYANTITSGTTALASIKLMLVANSAKDRITTFTYDAAGHQTKTTMAGWYDVSEGRVWAAQEGQSDRFQRTIEVTYDALGNAVANKIRTGISTYAIQYKTYDALGREVYDIDALGYATQKTYDALGNVKTVTRFGNLDSKLSAPTGSYWSTSDISSRLAGKAGRVITYAYDTLGRKTSVTQPGTSDNYRSSGASTLTNGSLAAYAYTAASVTYYQYDALGNLVKQSSSIDDVSSADTYFYYDKLGRQTWAVDAEKYGTQTEYDALGNVYRKTEYASVGTGTLNSITTVPVYASNSKNRISIFTYDTVGHELTSTRSLNGALTLVSTKHYTAFGDADSSKDAQNNLTLMEYNKLSKVTKVTEPSRLVAGTGVDVFKNQVSATPVTTMEYDTFGQSISQTRSTNAGLGATEGVTHLYDLVGNEIQTIDSLGNSTFMAYDVAGHMIKQTQSISVNNASSDTNYSYTLERRFEYDKAGRQIATLDVFNNGTQVTGQANEYNGFGEVITERKVWGSANATSSSLVSSETNNVLVNTYTYDDAGRIQYKQGADGYTYFYYDLLGSVTRAEQRGTNSSNTTTARVTENYYDKLGRTTVQRLAQSNTASTFGSTGVGLQTPLLITTFDRWGNALTRKDAAGNTTTYAYNQDNQVVNVTTPRAKAINYSGAIYDTDVSTSYAYDSLGRLKTEQAVGTIYGGGAYGSPVSSVHTSTNDYNAAGQLTRKTDASGVYQDFAYDANGNKVGTRDALGQVAVDYFDANNQLTSHAVIRAVQTITGYTPEQVTRQKTTTTAGPYGNSITVPVTETVITGYNTQTVTQIKTAPTGPYGSQVPVTETTIVGYTTTTTPVYSTVQTQTGTNAYGQPIYTTSTVQTGTTTTQTPIYDTHYVYVTVTTQTPIYVTRPVYETITVQNPIYAMVDTRFTQSQYNYDQAGRKFGEADAAGNYQYYQYDERDNILKSRNLMGNIKTFEYDELSNKIAEKETRSETYLTYTTGPYGGTAVSNSRLITVDLNRWSYKNTGGPYGANTDFVNFRSNLMQTRTIAGNSSMAYTYAYDNGFGQLSSETSSSSTTSYLYWENGLQKSITENSGGGNTSASAYFYDVNGNRTAETNNKTTAISGYTISLPYGASISVAATSQSIDNITYYQYDQQNRLTRIKSPAATMNNSGSTSNTTNLDLLSYDYDEWGNRRRISATYTLTGAGSANKTEWYAYDAAGRMTIGSGLVVGNTAVLNASSAGGQGVLYQYDGAGRRVIEERFDKINYTVTPPATPYGQATSTPASESYRQQKYTYNDLGQVTNIQERYLTRALGASTAISATAIGGYTDTESNVYDIRGFKISTVMQGKDRYVNSTYNNDGTIKSQITSVLNSGRTESEMTEYGYDTGGNVTSYKYKGYNINTGAQNFYNTFRYTYIDSFSGRQVQGISVESSQAGTAQGTTSNTYDSRGRLIASSITQNDSNNVTGTGKRNYAYNAAGQIISKSELKYGDSDYKTQNYYYTPTGGELANLGGFGVDISPLEAINVGASVSSSYTVNSGDTLMGIAQALFGDANLWYLIADANGLTQGPTSAFAPDDLGRSLRIPNSDKTVGNTSSTYKPFNAGEVIGDLTPEYTVVPPPPPKGKGCNVIAMIIIIVVAVVLTVVTAGAAAMLMAGQAVTMAGAWAAGTAVLAGGAIAGTVAAGSMAATLGTVGTAMAASFVGGFIGSVGSQVVGVGMGVQEKVNFRQAAASGLTASFGAAAGGVMSGGQTAAKLAETNQYGKIAANAAVSYAGNYAANKIAGLDAHFSWTNMAMSAVTAMGTAGASQALGLTTDKFSENFARGVVGAGVSDSTQKLFGRGSNLDRKSWEAAVVDAFGNAVANALVEKGLGGNFFGPKHGERSHKDNIINPEKSPAAVVNDSKSDDSLLVAPTGTKNKYSQALADVSESFNLAGGINDDEWSLKNEVERIYGLEIGSTRYENQDDFSEGRFIDVFKIYGGGGIHEQISEAAAIEAGLKYSKELDIGTRWPDVPESNLDEINTNYSGTWWNEHTEGTLAYRSHHGDLQIMHSMSPKMGMTNNEVLEGVVLQAWAWYEGAVEYKGNGARNKGDFEMGKLLHMVQDSYSKSHVIRNDVNEIVAFQNYEQQDPDLHGMADKQLPSEKSWRDVPGVGSAIKASAQLLKFYSEGAPFETVEKYLRSDVYKFDGGAGKRVPSGSSPDFLAKPTHVKKI